MRVWILTNGYGEDRAGAAVACELLARRSNLRVAAATLVTPGGEFSASGIPIEVAGAAPRSGGFPAAGLRTLVGDLPAVTGCLAYTRRLRRLASRDDEFVAVGDTFLTGLARLAFGKSGLHVSLPKSVHGRRHSRIERVLLKRWTRLVFARDAPTAADLQSTGVRAVFVGNPLIDDPPSPAGTDRGPARRECRPGPANGSRPFLAQSGPGPFPVRVLLLPGSRNEAPANLVKLLEVALVVGRSAEWACAWPITVPIEMGRQAAQATGWEAEGDALLRAGHVVTVTAGRFESLMAAADVVIGLAGTANERAAALGKPVVTCIGCGPQTTSARMEEQERLLGGACEFVRGGAEAVAAAVRQLIEQPEERRRRGVLGIARLGPLGGAGRVAERVIRELGL